MIPSQARKRGIAFLLALAIVIGGLVIFRSEPRLVPIKPSVQFLSAASKIPPQPATLFERWIPISWSWLWRLRDFIRGPLAGILIDAQIIDCTGLSDQAMADLLPEPALAETNGLRGWVLDDTALTVLQRQIQTTGVGHVIGHPRVQTAHGIQAALSVGNAHPSFPGLNIGLSLDSLPLIQPGGAELTVILTMTGAVTNRPPGFSVTEPVGQSDGAVGISIQTNLAAAARWELPDGTGFFLLGPSVSNDSRRICVIVTATVQRPKN